MSGEARGEAHRQPQMQVRVQTSGLTREQMLIFTADLSVEKRLNKAGASNAQNPCCIGHSGWRIKAAFAGEGCTRISPLVTEVGDFMQRSLQPDPA